MTTQKKRPAASEALPPNTATTAKDQRTAALLAVADE